MQALGQQGVGGSGPKQRKSESVLVGGCDCLLYGRGSALLDVLVIVQGECIKRGVCVCSAFEQGWLQLRQR